MMYQIAKAINALSTKDWFDYVSVAAPLVLSLVAIWISISTARKQNKIATFSLRYEALHSLALILTFAKMVKNVDKVQIVRYVFNANFACEINYENNNEALCQLYVQLRKVEKNVLIAEYLFSKNAKKELEQIFALLRNFLEQLVKNEVNQEWRDKFCAACTAFEQGTYQQLNKETRL